LETGLKELVEVTGAFMHALFDDRPLRRYMVVPNEEEHAFTIRTQVDERVQLNRWDPCSCSREKLIERLDEALAGGGPKQQ